MLNLVTIFLGLVIIVSVAVMCHYIKELYKLLENILAEMLTLSDQLRCYNDLLSSVQDCEIDISSNLSSGLSTISDDMFENTRDLMTTINKVADRFKKGR